MTFTVPTDAPNGNVIRNTFIAVSDQSPQVETIAEVIVETGPAVETTLAVRKIPDRTTVEPGETIHYTVEVTNTGTIPATNVVVRDSLTGTAHDSGHCTKRDREGAVLVHGTGRYAARASDR